MNAVPEDQIAQRIADRVRSLRETNRLKRGEMARRVGVAHNIQRRHERGIHTLTLDVILRYCRVLDILPSVFFECLDDDGIACFECRDEGCPLCD